MVIKTSTVTHTEIKPIFLQSKYWGPHPPKYIKLMQKVVAQRNKNHNNDEGKKIKFFFLFHTKCQVEKQANHTFWPKKAKGKKPDACCEFFSKRTWSQNSHTLSFFFFIECNFLLWMNGDGAMAVYGRIFHWSFEFEAFFCVLPTFFSSSFCFSAFFFLIIFYILMTFICRLPPPPPPFVAERNPQLWEMQEKPKYFVYVGNP